VTAIGVIGPTVVDTVVGADGVSRRRLGGLPLYARRSLRAAGADCVVVTRGADPGGAVVLPGGETYDSHIDHRDGTHQVLARIGTPFAAPETRDVVLPAIGGCEWLLLGPQSAGDFPDATLGLLTADRRVCMDAAGLARGAEPGPVRLRPFPPEAVAGVEIVKLNRAEALAAAGRLDREALLRLGAPEVVVTLAADGVLIATRDGFWVVPGTGAGAYPDPTGAGDSWTAAYLLGRSRGATPVEAATEAARHTDRLFL
jgi:sugar/nucleoside kinase (ribokinase family)